MISKLQYISQQTESLSHLTAMQRALAAGCDLVQLRVKNQPESTVLALAQEAKKLCMQYKAKLIINDYPEVALAVGADGLHLGLTDKSIPEARALVGKNILIGGTANTLADIRQRVIEGADYIGLGPFRFTQTKEKLSPVLGLAGYKILLQQVKAENITLPIIAIGGIGLADVAPLLEAGVYGIAISGALTQAADPAQFVQQVQQSLNRPVEHY
ncbi:thiamine phosphate synthase [Adhaeribacter rhizoryzae]|uniref:Thiamine-phosphate synthase n=1 Tax=Adhaeribacter rhizoryzae TaxID=2607907 RepID=A0A5M6CYL6_9BACT|nr:thiamine phosphate synthase [Adhaeribacter rhizoryzae]KAA5540327.1 thiamine phosphate synthase [Adhaeribacter rhizoryzae]